MHNTTLVEHKIFESRLKLSSSDVSSPQYSKHKNIFMVEERNMSQPKR